MQTCEFSHVWDHSSGSAVSWDVFRGVWHRTAISGTSLWRDVFFRGGWAVGVACVGFLSSRLIRSTCQVGHFSFVRYFECLEKFYFWKLFCHKAAGRCNNDSNICKSSVQGGCYRNQEWGGVVGGLNALFFREFVFRTRSGHSISIHDSSKIYERKSFKLL